MINDKGSNKITILFLIITSCYSLEINILIPDVSKTEKIYIYKSTSIGSNDESYVVKNYHISKNHQCIDKESIGLSNEFPSRYILTYDQVLKYKVDKSNSIFTREKQVICYDEHSLYYKNHSGKKILVYNDSLKWKNKIGSMRLECQASHDEVTVFGKLRKSIHIQCIDTTQDWKMDLFFAEGIGLYKSQSIFKSPKFSTKSMSELIEVIEK